MKIAHSDSVNTEAKLPLSCFGDGRMHAIIVDHEVIINVELGTVVGIERKSIFPRFLDPELAGIIDGKPFESLCDPGKPSLKLRGGTWRAAA